MEVELPDGTIAEFPDGTPPETIKAALQKRFGQQRSYPQELGRQLGLTGRYMVEGPANLAATFIGDPANSLINMGIRGINEVNEAINPPSMSELITGREPLVPYLKNPSEMVGPALTKMGFPEPENATERIVGEASKFLTAVPAFAGAAAGLGSAGVQGLAPMTQNLGQQGVGAVTGGLGYGATKEVTDNPFIQAGVGLATGIGGSMAAARLGESSAKALIPSAQKIKDMSGAAYKASEEAGAIVKPEAIQRLAANITDDLAEQAYIPLNAPKVGGVLAEIERISQGNVTLKGLDALRQAARDVANSVDASEARLGARMIDKIDDLVNNLQATDIVQGNKMEAVSALNRARTFWGNARKAELIDNAIESAKLRAASTGSGGNVENAIRQNLRKIVDNPKLRRGFTEAELAEIRKVVSGSGVQNLLRLVGKLSPQGSGLMMALGIGGAAANPALAAFPAAGLAAKAGADALTRSGASNLSQNIRGAITGTLQQPTTWAETIGRTLPLSGQMRLSPGQLQQRLLGAPSIASDQPDRKSQRMPR